MTLNDDDDSIISIVSIDHEKFHVMLPLNLFLPFPSTVQKDSKRDKRSQFLHRCSFSLKNFKYFFTPFEDEERNDNRKKDGSSLPTLM